MAVVLQEAGEVSNKGRIPVAFAIGLPLIAVFLRLFFWYYTDRTWDDALITLQHAENAARGLGLTHYPGGPRVHGFTSPISVLIPLFGELLHRGFGLTLQKIASAVCGGISVWLGMRIASRLALGTALVFLVGAYLAIEHHQILFGMAGMETQVAVAILLFSIDTLFDLEPVHVGIGLGLCMLARPDFLFWVAIVIALVGWHSIKQNTFRAFWVTNAAMLAVYGPWLAFTTAYYGSPVPNTIRAKALGYRNLWFLGTTPRSFLQQVYWRTSHLIFGPLGPAYAGNSLGFQLFFDHGRICLLVLLFLLPCAWTVLRRRDLPSLAILGFVVAYALYYQFSMAFVFGWYTVPLAAVTILAAAIGLNAVLLGIPSQKTREGVAYGVAFSYLACLAFIMPVTFKGQRDVQRFVEDGGRKQIGLYLASVAKPAQTVGCEPLGYIGYYSRRKVYEFPGLSNPEVVTFMREHPGKRNLIGILGFFRPDYLVLRPFEYNNGLQAGDLWLKQDYDLVREFRVPPEEVKQILFSKGSIELEFWVFARKHQGGTVTNASDRGKHFSS